MCLEACFDADFISHINSEKLVNSSCLEDGYSTVVGRTNEQLQPLLEFFHLTGYSKRIEPSIRPVMNKKNSIRLKSSKFTRQLKKSEAS